MVNQHVTDYFILQTRIKFLENTIFFLLLLLVHEIVLCCAGTKLPETWNYTFFQFEWNLQHCAIKN